MKLSDKQKIFSLNIAKLIIFAYENGYTLTFGEAWRPQEMQQIYFDTGRSKTLNSRHTIRLGVDFNIFDKDGKLLNAPKDIKILGDYWENLHPENVWGGDWDRDDNLDEEKFKDPYHFEMKP